MARAMSVEEAVAKYFGTGSYGIGVGVVCRACRVVVAGTGRGVHAAWHVGLVSELDRLFAEVERLRADGLARERELKRLRRKL